jgi:hypothetical protein
MKSKNSGLGISFTRLGRKRGHRGVSYLVEFGRYQRCIPGEQYAQLSPLSTVAQPGFTTKHHGPIGSLSHAEAGHPCWFAQLGSTLDMDHAGIHTQGSEERSSSKCLREALLSHRWQDTGQLRRKSFQPSGVKPYLLMNVFLSVQLIPTLKSQAYPSSCTNSFVSTHEKAEGELWPSRSPQS